MTYHIYCKCGTYRRDYMACSSDTFRTSYRTRSIVTLRSDCLAPDRRARPLSP